MTDWKKRFAPIDMNGQRIGMLCVVRRVANVGGNVCWECQCDCGKTITKMGIELRAAKKRGQDRYCGRRACAS